MAAIRLKNVTHSLHRSVFFSEPIPELSPVLMSDIPLMSTNQLLRVAEERAILTSKADRSQARENASAV
jgi:hypothetical protein